jgi:hypothetical protein
MVFFLVMLGASVSVLLLFSVECCEGLFSRVLGFPAVRFLFCVVFGSLGQGCTHGLVYDHDLASWRSLQGVSGQRFYSGSVFLFFVVGMGEVGKCVLHKVELGHVFVLRFVRGLPVWIDVRIDGDSSVQARWWLDFD